MPTIKILVVEDEPAVRRAVCRILAEAGYSVAAAAAGEEAVAKAGADFDIVITDLRLPGDIDGNEVARRFREAGGTDVIIMTGFPQIDTAIRGMRVGVYDYLIKPVSDLYLVSVIKRCVEKRTLSAELKREKELRAALDRAHQELIRLGRVRDIFGQFATPEVAQFVMSHPEDFWMRGERRSVSILFADVRQFTVFAASTTPEKVSQAINEVFSALQEAIRPEGGIINKLLGDGVMAVFGAPLPVREHESAAARAALSAQAALARLAARREALGLQGLTVGMGVNTGRVMAGCLGTKDRTEYSIIGAPINLAARLEKAALPGQILLGPDTWMSIERDFELKDMGMMAFHGVKEVVPVRALLCRRPQAAGLGSE